MCIPVYSCCALYFTGLPLGIFKCSWCVNRLRRQRHPNLDKHCSCSKFLLMFAMLPAGVTINSTRLPLALILFHCSTHHHRRDHDHRHPSSNQEFAMIAWYKSSCMFAHKTSVSFSLCSLCHLQIVYHQVPGKKIFSLPLPNIWKIMNHHIWESGKLAILTWRCSNWHFFLKKKKMYLSKHQCCFDKYWVLLV